MRNIVTSFIEIHLRTETSRYVDGRMTNRRTVRCPSVNNGQTAGWTTAT